MLAQLWLVVLRITLALGAGGPVGHAFHAGLLAAISHSRAWDARDAHRVLGTSAGAQVGALLRAGLSANDLFARVAGDPLSPEGAELARHYTRPPHERPAGARSELRPASLAYLRRALQRPWSARPGRLLSALLPAGQVCLLEQAAGFRRMLGDRWPERALLVAALSLHSGELVAFGAAGAPEVDVGTAVACSGAVPGVCAPVRVGAHVFVDGGMVSATNLDLLHATDDEVVIVSSPLSRFAPMRWLLRREVQRLRAAGKHVVVFEPRGEVAGAMGLDPMDLARAPAVARATYRTMLRELERNDELRVALRGGQRISPPSQQRSSK